MLPPNLVVCSAAKRILLIGGDDGKKERTGDSET